MRAPRKDDAQARRIRHGDRSLGGDDDWLGQEAIAEFGQPTGRLVGVLDGPVPWPSGVDVQVDDEPCRLDACDQFDNPRFAPKEASRVLFFKSVRADVGAATVKGLGLKLR